ncbi:MAG: tape measure protein [Escherichia coli]|nr:tape measure protein [Escherichia coli]
MDNINGGLAFAATLDIKDFNVSADAMNARVKQLSDTTAAKAAEMDQSLLTFAKNGAAYITSYLVGQGMTNLLTSIVQVRGQFQQLEIAFETMLGSKSKAHELMQQMEETAAKTPFDLDGVANGAKQLLAYGESADKVNDTLVRLGNIASGLSLPLNDIVYLYGTTMVQGRLYAADVRQFTGRGIPLVKELAKMYGVTADEINNMVSAGKIGFPDVQKVLNKLTDEGGQFYNLMEKQSKSLTGMISNLGDTWDQVQDHLGEQNQDLFAGAINAAGYFLEHLEDILKMVKAVAIAYGSYRAALVLNTIATKGFTGVALINNTVEQSKIALLKVRATLTGEVAAQTAAMTEAEKAHVASLQAELTAEEQANLKKTLRIQAITALLTTEQKQYLSNLNLTTSSQRYEAAAMGVLSVEQKMSLQKTELNAKSATYRAALEKEVLAKRKATEATLEQQRAEVKASYAKLEAAKNAAIASAQSVEAAKYEVYWAEKSGDATKIETAQKRLATAQDQAAASRKAALAAQTQFYTEKKNLETTASKASTAATAADNAAKEAQVVVTGTATAATNTFTLAVKNLWKAFKANPLGWIITLAGIAYSAFEMLKGSEEETDTVTQQLTEHTRKASDEFNAQAAKIDALEAQIHDENLSNSKKIELIGQLKAIIPGYNAELSKEGKIINENTAAIRAYLAQLEKQIKLKAAQEDLEAAYKKKRQLEKQQKKQEQEAKNADTSRTTLYNNAGAFIPTPIVGAKESGDAHSKLNQTKKDLAETNATINELKTEIETTTVATDNGTKKIQTYGQQVASVRSQISRLNQEIKNARAGKVKQNNLAEYIANKQKELQEAKSRLTALTGDKGGSGGGGGGHTGGGGGNTTEKKTFDEIMAYKRKQYELYYQWQQNLGKDVADKKFADLIKSGTSFLAWVNGHINALKEAKAKRGLSDEENSNLNSLMVQRDELMGVKSAMDAFKESVEAAISKASTLDEKLQAIADAKDKLSNGGYGLNPEDKLQGAMFLEDKQKSADQEVAKMVEQYQDYTQKRLAIEKEFDADISLLEKKRTKAKATGNTDEVDKLTGAIAQATAAKGKSLMAVDLEQLKADPDYIKAFENLNDVSTETLEKLKQEFESAKQTAAESLNPEDLREYTSTIQALTDEINNRNPFTALKKAKEDLKTADEELRQAELRVTQAQTKFGKGSKEEQAALEKLRQAKDKQIKKNRQYQAAEKSVTGSIKELCDNLDQVGSTIGGTVGEVISLVGQIGSVTMASIQGFETAANASSKAISTLEKASVILTIISSAYQIASKIISIFSDDDGEAAYQKAKEMYKSYIQVLNDVIDKQKELVSTLDVKNAQNSYEYAKSLYDKQADAARQMGKDYLNSGASKGFLGIGSKASHGVKQRENMSSEAWGQLDQWAKENNITQQILNSIKSGRMTGLFDLTIEQIMTLKEQAPLFFAKLDSDTQDYLNDLVGVKDAQDELLKTLNEGITGVDFDSVGDDFLDMLTDMDSDAKTMLQNLSNNFSDMMRKSMIQQMYKAQYKDQLQKWYNMWADAMKDGSDGGTTITDKEQGALDSLKNSIIQGATDAAQKINEQFKTADDVLDESSLEGAVASLSEETGSKIAGAMNATNINLADLTDVARNQLIYQAQTAHNTELIHQEMVGLRNDFKKLQNNGSLLSQGIA